LTAPVSDTRCPARRRSTLHRLLRTGFLCVHVGLVTNSNDRSLAVVWRVTSFETFKARFPKERHFILEVPSFQGKASPLFACAVGTNPSKKRVERICEKMSQMTQRKWCWKETEELVGELNLVIESWGNLLLAGIDEQSLPERGSSCTEPAASMVVPQA
jgi:hypothetical protein